MQSDNKCYSHFKEKDFLRKNVSELSRLLLHKTDRQNIWSEKQQPKNWPPQLKWKNPTSPPKDSVEVLKLKFNWLRVKTQDKLSESQAQLFNIYQEGNVEQLVTFIEAEKLLTSIRNTNTHLEENSKLVSYIKFFSPAILQQILQELNSLSSLFNHHIEGRLGDFLRCQQNSTTNSVQNLPQKSFNDFLQTSRNTPMLNTLEILELQNFTQSENQNIKQENRDPCPSSPSSRQLPIPFIPVSQNLKQENLCSAPWSSSNLPNVLVTVSQNLKQESKRTQCSASSSNIQMPSSLISDSLNLENCNLENFWEPSLSSGHFPNSSNSDSVNCSPEYNLEKSSVDLSNFPNVQVTDCKNYKRGIKRTSTSLNLDLPDCKILRLNNLTSPNDLYTNSHSQPSTDISSHLHIDNSSPLCTGSSHISTDIISHLCSDSSHLCSDSSHLCSDSSHLYSDSSHPSTDISSHLSTDISSHLSRDISSNLSRDISSNLCTDSSHLLTNINSQSLTDRSTNINSQPYNNISSELSTDTNGQLTTNINSGLLTDSNNSQLITESNNQLSTDTFNELLTYFVHQLDLYNEINNQVSTGSCRCFLDKGDTSIF